MRNLLVLLLAAAVAGCQTTVQTVSTFNPDEAAFIKKEGKGAIQGHAFLKRSTGAVVNAAGEIVRLTPATGYARERFAKLYNGRKFVSALGMPKVSPDPLYASFTRTTKADHLGRFRFENVAPGSYFISTQAVWKERGKYLPSGGAMFEEATLSGKEERPVEVVVSGN